MLDQTGLACENVVAMRRAAASALVVGIIVDTLEDEDVVGENESKTQKKDELS